MYFKSWALQLGTTSFSDPRKRGAGPAWDPYISFVWLMELKKEFNAAVLDLERANLSKAA
ncbi:hypothetical protein EBQ90_10220 [bacterium]|nr:hypothetical protein [bacterium]